MIYIFIYTFIIHRRLYFYRKIYSLLRKLLTVLKTFFLFNIVRSHYNTIQRHRLYFLRLKLSRYYFFKWHHTFFIISKQNTILIISMYLYKPNNKRVFLYVSIYSLDDWIWMEQEYLAKYNWTTALYLYTYF